MISPRRLPRSWDRTPPVYHDDIYLKDYETVEELTRGLRIFFDDYNNERPHSSLGGKTPADVYFGAASLRQAA